MSGRARGWRVGTAAVALISLLLAGCGGLLPAPPQRQLYRVEPRISFPAALPHVAAQLLVATPSAPAGLDTRRIALTRSAVTLDYFADAEWTDRVPFLVQSALVDGFEKSGAVPAVGPEGLGLHADFVLDTAIREFAAVYDSPNGAPRAVVVFDAKLIRMPDRRIVAQAEFRGDAAAGANAVADIVHAFDAALGRAVAGLVTWTARNPALSRRAATRYRGHVSFSRPEVRGGVAAA